MISIYKEKKLNPSQKRVKNLINLAKYKFRENKKKVISILLIICLLIETIKVIPRDLKIYFIDVGQGDSTLIVTPLNKNILIDGGGSEIGSYDVGKNTLLPYLLDRKIKIIDYIIISHFDTDHVQGLFVVMEQLKVKNVIIGKQFEASENYKKFLKIIKEKKINTKIVQTGDRINIENNIYFDVIWPMSETEITENSINNNALTCKLNFNSFSMLFTGDIEKETENIIVSKFISVLPDIINGFITNSFASTLLYYLCAAISL